MIRRFLLSACLLLAPLWAFAQCTECASSAGSVEITVDATKVDAAIIFGYIPMSRLPTGIHDAMAADGDTTGATLRMETADASAECAIWVPSYVGASDTGALIWRLTGLSASVDTVYRLHHVPGATMYSTSATYGRNAVFSGYAGAWMPGVTTDGLTGSYNLTGVNTPGTGAWVEGLSAATFNGTDQYYKYEGDLSPTVMPISVGAIIKSLDNGSGDVAVGFGQSTSGANFMRLYQAQSSVNIIHRFDPGSGTNGSAIAVNTRRYLTGTRDVATTGTTKAYVDGVKTSTDGTANITERTYNRLGIGALIGASVSAYYYGECCFVSILASVRSVDEAMTEYKMWTDSAFYSVGAWVPSATNMKLLPILSEE